MKFIEGSYLVLKEVINADFKKEIIQRMIESYAESKKQPEFLRTPASFLVILKNLNAESDMEVDPSLTDKEKVLKLLNKKK